MKHYVPASLENITLVTEYVTDEKNEDEMKSIVDSANSWCQREMIKAQMATNAVIQLQKYETALGKYMDDVMDKHNMVDSVIDTRARLFGDFANDDLVECSSKVEYNFMSPSILSTK